MKNLTAAIAGARPKSRGYNMGDFHAREFHKAGVKVVAIANTSLESAASAAEDLQKEFGINAKPFQSLEALLKQENPDIVVIATPPETHYKNIMLALNAGCHVLAEKPLCWDLSKSPEQNFKDAKYLFKIAARKGRVLAANHQLASLCDAYIKIFNDGEYGNFRNCHGNFELKLITPGVLGKENNQSYASMDLLPHALSFLVKMFPEGHISSAVESSFSEGESVLRFMFGNGFGSISARLRIGYNRSATELSFGLNGLYVTKQIEKADAQGVSYSLIDGNGTLLANVGDPLREFDKRFVAAVANNNPGILLVNPEQALGIMRAQYLIMNHLSQQN